MKNEKNVTPLNGYMMAVVLLVLATFSIIGLVKFQFYWLIPFIILEVFSVKGFFIVNPNGSNILVLFGKYKGTVRENGFFWTNPFNVRYSIPLRARNFDSERLKVNDRNGNPIMISVILVWNVKNTYKALFDVDNYDAFVRIQTDAAVRKVAGSYSYDNFDDDQTEVTLRSGLDEINDALEKEIMERLEMAGIIVLEARIGYLAYANEIASAMLKRQQAEAIVAARKKIVEGAVSMVEDALEQLSRDNIIEFDEDKKANMVSNLMVVLCSDKDVTPVINTGTLNM